MPGPRALVTGGAGFIGSHLVAALLDEGHEVRVLDNLATGCLANLDAVAGDVDVRRGDVRSAADVAAAMTGIDVVFHQGALPSVPRSIDDPLSTHDVNVTGTLMVLLAARAVGVARVVFASSSSVYGDAGPLARVETATPRPVSPYAASKLAGERYCLGFAALGWLDAVVLRYFNVYGPRQRLHARYANAVPRFMTAIAAGEPVPIHGDGLQRRDLSFVDDVVHANLLAMRGADVAGQVVNVGSGRQIAVGELAERIGGLLERPVLLEHLPPRQGDVRDSWADVGRARELLGHRPRVSLDEGLRRTAAALLDAAVA